MQHLRSYQLAVQFYSEVKTVRLPAFLKNQLLRAASSVALNLAEGTGKLSMKDRVRFYQIALGSIRECQAVLQIEGQCFTQSQHQLLDQLGAATYRLVRMCR